MSDPPTTKVSPAVSATSALVKSEVWPTPAQKRAREEARARRAVTLRQLLDRYEAEQARQSDGS